MLMLKVFGRLFRLSSTTEPASGLVPSGFDPGRAEHSPWCSSQSGLGSECHICGDKPPFYYHDNDDARPN
jgi:hypothetical protein